MVRSHGAEKGDWENEKRWLESRIGDLEGSTKRLERDVEKSESRYACLADRVFVYASARVSSVNGLLTLLFASILTFSLDHLSVAELKLKHRREAKGLLLDISYLKTKFTRENTFREDLSLQKEYLLILIGDLSRQ